MLNQSEIRQASEQGGSDIAIPGDVQGQIQAQNSLFWDIAQFSSSSALGAGFGYFFGSLIKTLVDLSKIGIAEMQKQKQEDRDEKYIGPNEYTISGLSIGMALGAVTYACVSNFIRVRNEREEELQAVRQNIDGDTNFSGALDRGNQQVSVLSFQRIGGISVESGVDVNIVIGDREPTDPRSLMIDEEDNMNSGRASIFPLQNQDPVEGSGVFFRSINNNVLGIGCDTVFVKRPVGGVESKISQSDNASIETEDSVGKAIELSLASPRGEVGVGLQIKEEGAVVSPSFNFVSRAVRDIEEKGKQSSFGAGR